MKNFWILVFSFMLTAGICNSASLIDVNTATLEELETLTGIGSVKAQAIIDARPYSSVDELTNAKGIGEKTLAKIKEQGLAYVSGMPKTISNFQSSIPNKNTDSTADIQIVKEIKTYPSGIFLNEILPSAAGSDETGEYIKIYNSNNFEVDLTGWKLRDTAGTITTYTISSGTKISILGFLTFKRPETKITLNNDGDGAILLNPDNKIADSTEFQKASKGWIWKNTSSGWQWLNSQLTSSNALPKTKNSVNNKLEVDLTDINKDVKSNQEKSLSALINSKANPWFLFLTAIILTIISAITILLIKFKLNKHVRT